MHHPTDRITHTTAVVEHLLEREIAEREKERERERERERVDIHFVSAVHHGDI